jgi:hypothetical protein
MAGTLAPPQEDVDTSAALEASTHAIVIHSTTMTSYA